MLARPRRAASAPGRVTILGEHTDYNAGRSLGVATSMRTSVSATFDATGVLVVRSRALGSVSCPLAAPAGPPHVLLAAALALRVGVEGVRLDVDGDLPVGAGLSSSAAYAVATALALGLSGDPLEVAVACQEAERSAGSDVGLLDQLVVLFARGGEVVHIDFAGPVVSTLPLSPAVALSIVDTGERRLVAATTYADRRLECAEAARVIGRPLGTARPEDLAALPDGTLRRRARHVVTECDRVRHAVVALADGDLELLGRLLDEGHASLRDDFEVSTAGVERARDEVRATDGVTGARLTGAGFGGWLVVAHDPARRVAVRGRSCIRLEPGSGAAVSSTR